MKTKLNLCLIITILSFSFLSAQENLNPNNKVMEFWKHEKIRIPLDSLRSIINNPPEIKQNRINDKNEKTNSADDIIVSDDYEPESEVHAAINPLDSNNIVISPIRMSTNFSDFSELLLCPVYYTKDFGKTWSKSSWKNKLLRTDLVPGGGGDPLFVFDKQGTLYHTWIYLAITMTFDSMYNSMHWAYSTDGGVSFKREMNEYIANKGFKYGELDEFYDKQWLACDYSNSQYSNNIYLSLTHLNPNTGADIEVYRKENGTKEFDGTPTIISKDTYKMTQFSQIDVDNAGVVHVVFYGEKDNVSNSLFHSKSTDGGKTFLPETKITDFVFSGSNMINGSPGDQFIGFNPDRLYPCPQMAIDNSGGTNDGNIYLTWTAVGITENEGNGLNVYLIKSTDGGDSWSEPITVHDDPKGMRISQFYSSISVNPNGALAVSWYDRRGDSKDYTTNYYIAYSFDGGDNFGQNIKVSTSSTDFRTVGELNNDFGVGEYNELLTTKGYAIPVWSDGRSNDGNMNIYTSFVPITKDPTSVESITPINADFSFSELMPNPASDITTADFEIRKKSSVQLFVSDVNGNNVLNIEDKILNPGQYNFPIRTDLLSSGYYFVNLVVGNTYSVKKLIIEK